MGQIGLGPALLFAFLAAGAAIDVKLGDDYPWTWMCQNDKCVKTLRVSLPPDQPPTPLSLCKLNCAENGVLWPKPTGKVTLGKTLFRFVPRNVHFQFQAEDPQVRSLLQNASRLFNTSLLQMHPDYKLTAGQPLWNGSETQVNVNLGAVYNDQVNTLRTDEAYALSIRQDDNVLTVAILANTFFGARHGLETLSQLVAYDDTTNTLAMVSNATVSDRPVFPYRGVMIDTSRNFFSVESLERLLDGMASTKLNVLHWHLTDTHSFPFLSRRVPELAHYGAYSKTKVYSPEQIKDLVNYARVRGVKIVPEFDEPAHTGNGWEWGPSKGLGNLAVCVNQEPWEDFCVEPPCGQLNVVNEHVYDVLGNLFRDFLDVFDKDVFHMGGDEINFNCWNSSKEITDWMEVNGMNRSRQGFLDLWSRFQNKAYEKLKEANEGKDLEAILWTSELTGKDVVEKYVSNAKYIIQVWTQGDDALIPFLVSKNYRLILSNYDAWYLDCGFGAWVGGGPNNWCSPYKGWQQVYANSPLKILANSTSPETAEKALKAGLLLGGVSPMWSEQVDEAALESRVWPRAAALGERLWSNPTTGWAEAEVRMVHMRQRLVQRGIGAERLQPEWCYQNEGRCVLRG